MGNLPDRWKGYLLAFVATLAMSNVYLFSKSALNIVHLFQFGTYWFGFAILLNLTYLFITGRIRHFRSFNRKNMPVLFLIGILETFGTALFFKSLNIVENPAVVSFLANMTPLLVTILGITFLHERFNIIEGFGIVLTLTGAFVLSYQSGGTGPVFLQGSGYLILSSLLFAISMTLARKNIGKFDAGVLSLNRVIFLFSFMLGGLIITGKSILIPGKALMNISLGSFLGPFLTAIVQYTSLRFIEASRSMLIQSSKGIFVLLGTFFFFGLLPGNIQIAGGILTIAGVILIITGKQSSLYISGIIKRPGFFQGRKTSPKTATGKRVASLPPAE